jgi:uncharacterized membrane protein
MISEAQPLFEAVIVPHRSLSRRGLLLLSAALILLSGASALRFWLLGAWPVLGFTVVEIGLALVLLRINALQARESEMLLLTADRLRILRTDRKGRRSERLLPAGWLNVVMTERPGRVPRLALQAHGMDVEVGAALGEDEKRDLAAALQEALHRLRNPRFDNPQLREGGG